MNRVQRNKLICLAIVVGGLVAAVLALQTKAGVLGLVAVAVLMLVPGRVGAYFLKDLFLSRRFNSEQEFARGIDAAKRYLDSLNRQPWRQHFIYCFFGVYTWNTAAMALNNMAAAEMELGRIDDAEHNFAAALQLDGEYPLPYYNLAVLAKVKGDDEHSWQLLSTAQQLGYSAGTFDQMVARVGTVYARIQTI